MRFATTHCSKPLYVNKLTDTANKLTDAAMMHTCAAGTAVTSVQALSGEAARAAGCIEPMASTSAAGTSAASMSAASTSAASANSKSSEKTNQRSTAERRASRNAEKMKPWTRMMTPTMPGANTAMRTISSRMYARERTSTQHVSKQGGAGCGARRHVSGGHQAGPLLARARRAHLSCLAGRL